MITQATPVQRRQGYVRETSVVFVTLLIVLLSLSASDIRIGQPSARQPVVAEASGLRTRNVATAQPVLHRTLTPSQVNVDLSEAIEQRTKLLTHTTNVHFTFDGKDLATWGIMLQDFPSWVIFEVDANGKGTAGVSAERVKQQLIGYPIEGIPQPQTCNMLSTWIDEFGVTRVQTDCIARSGYTYDINQVAQQVKEALDAGLREMTVPLTEVRATITPMVEEGSTGEPMSLLAVGRSNFKGSGGGRKANVRKALNEHLNNTYVASGAVFFFNKVLGKSVNTSNGWQMALTIFEGGELRPAPGGGICQVSTTLYRAALNSGFPIVEQRNHSLYVTYYEKYGVGQDATVFPGSQDLAFLNDTGGPLLIQSYNDGDEAYVNIYGRDDNRTVTLSGPYFSRTAPEDLQVKGRQVRANEIVWLRSVTKGDERKDEQFVARYQSLPKSLSSRWQPVVSQVRGTTVQASNEVIAER
jgi:hypothetical protein